MFTFCLSRKLSVTSKAFKNYYDILGITPKATQNDVKSAFYKLSKIYHPDKNKGSEESSKRFQDISSAYEVLGNYQSRKLYDKGLIFTDEKIAEEYDDNPEGKFYRSRRDRHRAPAPSGRTPIYDFDEWSRAHYSDSFQKSQARKNNMQINQHKTNLHKDAVKLEVITLIIALSVAGFCSTAYVNRELDTIIDE